VISVAEAIDAGLEIPERSLANSLGILAQKWVFQHKNLA
jgi:hypothetical protein